MSNTSIHTSAVHTNATAAFDTAAAEYDTAFSFSQTGTLQRKRVHHFLKKQAASLNGKNVLELNCGTGEDALWLAGYGAKVLATDQSANMMAQLQSKLQEAQGLDIHTMQCAFNEVMHKLPLQSADFILSNFGGLNCISSVQMASLASNLELIAKDDAQLALVVMSKKCWWEKIYFRLKGNKQAARRRQSDGPVTVSFGSEVLPVWYYHPREIEKIFAAGFTKLYQKPVGIFLPPSYMEGYFEKRKWLLKFLYGTEKLLGHCSFLAPYADHYLIVFKKR
jgi:ubiquinone/menaquinone biosynthesis C-methylase UbiE